MRRLRAPVRRGLAAHRQAALALPPLPSRPLPPWEKSMLTPEMRQILIEILNEKLKDYERINSALLWPRVGKILQCLKALEEDQGSDRIRARDVVIFVLLAGAFLWFTLTAR